MENHKNFFYINFQKAGSTHCVKTIRKNFETAKIGGLFNKKIIKTTLNASRNKNKIVFTSMREPVSWYKSWYKYMDERGQKFPYFKQNDDFDNFIFDIYEKGGEKVNTKLWHQVIDFDLIKNNDVGVMTLLYINYFYPNHKKEIIEKLENGDDVIETMHKYEKYNVLDDICYCKSLNKDLERILKKATGIEKIDFLEKKTNISESKLIEPSEEVIQLIKNKEKFIYHKYYNNVSTSN